MHSALSISRSSAARLTCKFSPTRPTSRVVPSSPSLRLARPASTFQPRQPQAAFSSIAQKKAAATTPARTPAAKPATTTTNTTPKTTPKPTPTPTAASSGASQEHPLTSGLSDALSDPPPVTLSTGEQVDWTRSYHGLSSSPFTETQAAILQAELNPDDVEIKPDGIIYLPEIKYRRILNKAFGPGGWGLAPRGETIVTGKVVTREYGLVAGGRLISIARGEQQYFDPDGIPTATEGCKSNALMRCCKDLGVASELWDPRFIRKFLKTHGKETFVEHQTTKKRRKHFMRKDDEVRWPFKDVGGGAKN